MEGTAVSSSAAFFKERVELRESDRNLTSSKNAWSFIIDLTVTYIEQKWRVMLDKWKETG